MVKFKIKKKRGSLNFDDPTWFLIVICCLVIATIFYGHNIDYRLIQSGQELF